MLTGPLTTVAIPDTLQDALMARLDQLNKAKDIAQCGIVYESDLGLRDAAQPWLDGRSTSYGPISIGLVARRGRCIPAHPICKPSWARHVDTVVTSQRSSMLLTRPSATQK